MIPSLPRLGEDEVRTVDTETCSGRDQTQGGLGTSRTRGLVQAR